MKMTRIDLFPKTMKIKEPYEIAYETIAETTNVFLRIETDEKITGFGCAAPDFTVTGESSESVMDFVKTVAEPCLIGADPLRYSWVMDRFSKKGIRAPSALAMIDMALYDILGKRAKLPLYKLLGGFRTRILTSVTIGILPVAQTVEKAKAYVAEGFKSIKLKGGKCVEEDIEKITKIRACVDKKIEIRFDANQGYSESEVYEFIKKAAPLNISLIEQPTKQHHDELLGRVTRKTNIPVMADESLMNLKDAFRFAKRGLVDMVNIKLMKVGGIGASLKINSVARAAGLKAMIGCMDEADLGICAGLHLALSQPNVLYADLDGHFDLMGDPSKDAVILKNGMLFTTEKPGLGFDLNEKALM